MPGQKTQGLGLLLYRLTEAAYSRQPRGPEVQDLGEGPFQWPPSVRRLLPVSLLRPAPFAAVGGPVFSLEFRV